MGVGVVTYICLGTGRGSPFAVAAMISGAPPASLGQQVQRNQGSLDCLAAESEVILKLNVFLSKWPNQGGIKYSFAFEETQRTRIYDPNTTANDKSSKFLNVWPD